MRSALFSPAARTRTSTSPAPGTGSGRSATTSCLSTMVAARTVAACLELGRQELEGPVLLLPRAERGGAEVGGPGVGDRLQLLGHALLVAHDGHVAGPDRALLVQHGPIGRQLAVDGEGAVGPLLGPLRVVGDADGQADHHPRRRTSRLLG